MAKYSLSAPLTGEVVEKLKIGDRVLLSGIVYTARDAAHKRFIELIKAGEEFPVDLHGQIIYYVGPTPARPGCPTGAAGPTTSSRMDPYTPMLISSKGLKAMIGKGSRSLEVRKALQKYKAVYFAAIGGAGALISCRIKKAEVVAYRDLGPEAVYKLTVEKLPVIVVNDCHGGDLYEEGRKKYVIS